MLEDAGYLPHDARRRCRPSVFAARNRGCALARERQARRARRGITANCACEPDDCRDRIFATRYRGQELVMVHAEWHLDQFDGHLGVAVECDTDTLVLLSARVVGVAQDVQHITKREIRPSAAIPPARQYQCGHGEGNLGILAARES